MIDYLQCNCSDYSNQSIAFENKKVCCKHVFATLGYLGFERLEQYQNFVDEQLAERMISQIEEDRMYSDDIKNYA